MTTSTTSLPSVADAVRALFARGDSEPSEETIREYERQLALFSTEWKSPKAVGADFSFCTSLVAAGLLERNTETLYQGAKRLPVGTRVTFRVASWD